MQQRWAEFLHGSSVEHGVQIYGDPAELATSVAAFFAAGLDAGQPAVAVATPAQWASFAAALDARGWDAATARERGLVVVADAAETLAAIMDGGEPSAERFERVIGGLLDRAVAQAPDRDPRLFGEMVDLLARQGLAEAAFRLEALWNELARHRRFALLCGYQLDVFDPAAQARLLPHVCGLHQHVLPAGNYARLASAVDRALDEVLGSAAAGGVYRAVARERDDVRVPMAQLIMMWVSANMPGLAERVLESARAHYGATAASAAA
jgi:hypothetical protein